MKEKIKKTDSEWRACLTPMQYAVTRGHGTEPPFQNAYNSLKAKGTYKCVCCKQPLFKSETKYDSGTGWPSFFEAIDPDAVSFHEDFSGGRVRTEVRCSRCDAHLGHIFDDGPEPTGKRYCMNSASLDFEESST